METANQNRRWDYKDEDSTLWMGKANSPFRPAGRYAGFEVDTSSISTNTLKLIHTNGWDKVELGSLTKNIYSVWETRQGQSIEQKLPVELLVNTNVSGDPRIDLIVGSHSYVETVGGTAGIYSIVQGTPAANPVAPAVANPLKDVILGRILVPDAATVIADMTYVPEPTPSFSGDDTVGHSHKALEWLDTQTFNSLAIVPLEATIGSLKIVLTRKNIGIGEYIIGNLYDVNYTGGSSSVSINTIDLEGETVPTGYSIKIKSNVELYFDTNSVFTELVTENVSSDKYIVPVDTYFRLTLQSSGKWLITSDSKMIYAPVKFFENIYLNRVTVPLAGFGLGDSDSKGSLWEINNAGSDTVKYIKELEPVNTAINTAHGQLIVVKFIGDTNAQLLIEHEASGAPSGYVNIVTPNKEDLTLSTNYTLMFIRAEYSYHLIGYYPTNTVLDTWNNVVLVLTNGFLGDGTNVPQYRVENNLLRFRGEITINPASYFLGIGAVLGEASLVAAAGLPVDARPSRDIVKRLLLLDGNYPTDIANNHDAELIIYTNGSMSISTVGGWADTKKFYLNDLVFDIS